MIRVREIYATEHAEAAAVSTQAFIALCSIYKTKPGVAATNHGDRDKLTRLVAVEDGKIIGTVKYRVDRDRLHMIGLAVLPHRRHQGVARCLVDDLYRVASEQHCSVVSLSTIRQTGNVEVFERLGFYVVREQPDSLAESVTGESLTDVYMERSVG